jgi:urease accessory protein
MHTAHTTTITTPIRDRRNVVAAARLLRLLHLASPALPIGAFAFSQGLEAAVSAGWVHDEEGAGRWILGLLGHSLASIELPILARLRQARARLWCDRLHAMRGARELQEEERRLGTALARALVTLAVPGADAWTDARRASPLALLALASVHWAIAIEDLAGAYAFAWAENQIGAAMRLVPLGQSSGLRLVDAAIAAIPAIVERALVTGDDEVGFGAPGQAIAGALHETQYSRIFRS